MAPKRSYGAKANKGKAVSVFLHNWSVEAQRNAKIRRKEREAQEKRDKKAKAREDAKQLVEAEKAKKRQRIERERERVRVFKENEKIKAKVSVVLNRVQLELEKLQVGPSNNISTEIAMKAVEAGVTAAQVKDYFIKDNVNQIASSCADELLESIGIDDNYNDFHEFDKLRKFATDYRPQSDVSSQQEFQDLVASHKDRVKRTLSRAILIKNIIYEKIFFSDQVDEFEDLIEHNDWSKSEALKSSEFKDRVKEKKDYVAFIKSKLIPFSLTN